MRAAGRLCAVVALAATFAGTAAPAASDPTDESPAPRLAHDTVVVDAKGKARIVIQPEFRPAGALQTALLEGKIKGLAVHLVSPRVQPFWEKGKAPPTVLSRLLLMGDEAAVRLGIETLRRLDAPPRAVRVCMTVAEVWGGEVRRAWWVVPLGPRERA